MVIIQTSTSNSATAIVKTKNTPAEELHQTGNNPHARASAIQLLLAALEPLLLTLTQPTVSAIVTKQIETIAAVLHQTGIQQLADAGALTNPRLAKAPLLTGMIQPVLVGANKLPKLQQT